MQERGSKRLHLTAPGLVYLAVIAAAFNSWAVVVVLAALAGAALCGGLR